MMFSGDTDSAIPVTSAKYAVNKLKLSVKTAWYPWYLQNEVILLIAFAFLIASATFPLKTSGYIHTYGCLCRSEATLLNTRT